MQHADHASQPPAGAPSGTPDAPAAGWVRRRAASAGSDRTAWRTGWSGDAGRVLRAAGRGVLWAAVALVAVRGVQALFADAPRAAPDRGVRAERQEWPDAQARWLAVELARAYLSRAPGGGADRAGRLSRLMAEGLSDQAAIRSPHRPGVMVAQATVAREAVLGRSRALITVAVLLSTGRARQLTVPVARDEHGRVVVDDLPFLSAPAPRGSIPAARWDPLDGSDAAAIEALVRRFLATYIPGSRAAGLAYLLAPGARVSPLPSGLRLASVDEIGQAPGRADRAARRDLAALVHVRDRAGRGVVLPMRFRLSVVRGERWHVASVATGAAR